MAETWDQWPGQYLRRRTEWEVSRCDAEWHSNVFEELDHGGKRKEEEKGGNLEILKEIGHESIAVRQDSLAHGTANVTHEAN